MSHARNVADEETQSLWIGRCSTVLSDRLTSSGAGVASEDIVVLAIALDYLSTIVVTPPGKIAMIEQAAIRDGVDPIDVIRLLTPIREAVRFRSLLGEWIRGELVFDGVGQRRTGYQHGHDEVLVSPNEVRVAASSQDDPELTGWRRRMRELIGGVRTWRFGKSFTGTPGVTNYVNKDESPE